ncbi:hypothetical protein [Paenibacillus sp. HJGM_3]|uniref:hypothetical protein n=1 Tax=Paenibacillus sp. HJGM_3 TaxID=3379816 RepID=UPI0038655252
MIPYILLIALFVLVAAVSTVLVGVSKTNREGNPDYERRTTGNMVRLTSFYVLAAIVGIAILLYILF